MRIGVPKETKTLEGRVALVPAAAGDLVKRGHEVWLEQGAGLKSGFQDEQYTQLGVRIAPDAAALYEKGEMIVKVKEPIAGDLQHLRRDHLLFCYLHLAAEPDLTKRLLDIGLTSIAFETVELPNGDLPLLAPMSIIAGRIATQVGTTLLHMPQGGKGKLLGGLPSTERGKVVVFGAGKAGGASAALAAAGGANVTVFEMRQDRMDEMMRLGPNVTALYPYHDVVAREVASADLVIGAVLVTGEGAARADARDAQGNGGRQRRRGHLDRPGRLLRDLAPDHVEGADVRGGGRDPLLRDQHARLGAADQLAGDLRGDPAVGEQAGVG